MAICSICTNERLREIDRQLLTHKQVKLVAKQFGVTWPALGRHRRLHLPWWNLRRGRPKTIREQLEYLKYELSRLQRLAECGEDIGRAIGAVTAKRQVLELEARLEGKLDATHRKLAFSNRQPEGEFEVVFQGGKAKTVEVKQ